MAEYAWLVPLLPLVAYVFLLVLGRKAPEGIVTGISVLLTFVAFLISTAILSSVGNTGPETYVFHWLSIGSSSTDGWLPSHAPERVDARSS